MFTLSENPIDPSECSKQSTATTIGACVTFEGIVRSDKHPGKEVSALLYIADAPACFDEGNKIIQETLSLFPVTQAICIQRIGKVNVAETAVWIGVWSTHRDESFKACRYIIEEIKKRLLIWKKEFLTDGTSQWVRRSQTSVIL